MDFSLDSFIIQGRLYITNANSCSTNPSSSSAALGDVVLHRHSSQTTTSSSALLPSIMSSSTVRWSCKACKATLDTPRRTHPPCHSETTYTCPPTGRSGHFDQYKRHAQHYQHCTPAQQQHILEEKAAAAANRAAAVEENDRSEWTATHLAILRCSQHPH